VRAGLIIVVSAIAAVALQPASSLAADVADLGVTILASEATTPDTDVTYAITVQNGGPDDSLDVTLSDDVPVGTTFVSFSQDTGPAFSCSTPIADGIGPVTCTAATLAAGAVATFTLTVHVNADTPRGDFITDQARVASAAMTFDPNEENDTSTQSSLVGPVTTADVGVGVVVPEAAAPDTDVGYAITVQNGGPDAADATLTDTLPGSLTFVSLDQTTGPTFICSAPAVGTGGMITCDDPSMAAGATATFTLVAHVSAGSPAARRRRTSPR
jgi:uncharacterized repeat protein (TIGR01451 family)